MSASSRLAIVTNGLRGGVEAILQVFNQGEMELPSTLALNPTDSPDMELESMPDLELATVPDLELATVPDMEIEAVPDIEATTPPDMENC